MKVNVIMSTGLWITVLIALFNAIAHAESVDGKQTNREDSVPPLTSVLVETIELDTTVGKIKGRTDGEIATFQGIPYAEAPVGDNRWRPAIALQSFDTTLDATKFGSACMQRRRTGYFADPRPVSEDCLTLNIWSTNHIKKAKPVIVWIHGGAFVIGSSKFPFYDGEAFARSGIVFVSINYRLGRFGYFAHPALRDETKVTNFAYTDQVAALKWVKDNIASFGGDPTNVTIAGESAGGVSVTHLLSMPDAQGLFHKAIVQSGSGHRIEPSAWKRRGFRPPYDEKGMEWTESIKLKGSDADLAKMRELPSDSVLGDKALIRGIGPSIDGLTLTQDVAKSFELGNQAAVPLLIGATSFEGSLATKLGTKPEQILKLLGRRVEELRAKYAEIGLELDDVELAYQAYGDATFVSPARYLARLMVRKGVPVWLYHFDVVPEARRENSRGAPHGGEIPYVFKTASRLSRMSAAIGPSDVRIADLMHKAWVAFAKKSDPNHSSLSIWKPVTLDSTPTLVVTSDGAKIDHEFEKPVHDFFDDRFGKLRRLFPMR